MFRRHMSIGSAVAGRLVQHARVLVIVAIQTQQFPVTAVGRIVVVVMIFVVDSEFTQTHTGKLARAAAANPGKQFERAFAITRLARFTLLACFGDNTIKTGVIWNSMFRHGV